MKDIINGIIYAISYFTIIPVKVNYFDANNKFYKGVLFGLVFSGFLLSLIISALYIFISSFMPNWYSAYFVAIIYIFLYGFLHIEAVADTLDGYYAALSKRDVYEVMHEPQVGSIGAVGAFCFVLLKVLALGYLLLHEEFIFIALALTLSRLSVLFALSLEFHEKSTFVLSLQKSINISVIFKLLFLPINLLSKFILKILQKRIGFLNGDTLGFSIVLIEIIILNLGIIIL